MNLAFKITQIFIFLIITLILFSCNDKANESNNQKYEKIDFYTKDSFDLRIEKFLAPFENSNNFALIDYHTCARCSESKIDNFFEELSINEKLNIIFNDSIVYNKYQVLFPNVKWDFINSEEWKQMHLESSNIVRYKRHNNKHIERID